MTRCVYDVFFQYEERSGQEAISHARDVVRSALDDSELGVEELSSSGPRGRVEPYPVAVRVRISSSEKTFETG